ncbi:MAG: ROK family protein [Endomicrobium sp.]|jgi:glucokinase|nr:ROK family protein [Endomicrobium sp.]
MSKELYLGIDIGGTKIKMAVVTSKGSIKEEMVSDTDINAKPLNIVKSVIKTVSKFKNYSKIKNIGVEIAGDVSYDTGIVRFSPNLHKWKKVPLKEMFEKITGKKTYIGNDANTASMGAFWLDTKEKASNLICITLGTGLGGGLIFNKKLYRGASGTAGEIGHISIDPYGQKCKCGNNGCIETFIGAKYLSKHAIEYLKESKSSVIDELTGKNHSLITPQLLFEAAVAGDEVAKDIWKIMGEKLGIFLSNIINFANPDTIVICGGIIQAGKYFMGAASNEIKKRAFELATKSCKILISKYTHKLGVVGAAMLLKR